MQAVSRGNKKEMTNYYRILNCSNMEYIDPTDLGCVDTLIGFCTQDSRVTKVLQVLLYDRWSGCDVVVLGENARTSLVDMENHLSDGNWLHFIRHYEQSFQTDSIFDLLSKEPGFINVSKDVLVYEDAIGEDPVLLVNGNLMEFVDVTRLEGTSVGLLEKKISPVILLLTAGNGYGPGDYTGPGEEFVGRWLSTWASSVEQIYCMFDEKQGIKENLLKKGYKELVPGFRY